MPTNNELKNQIDTDITNKVAVESISTEDVGGNMKDIVDYVDQEVSAIPAGPQGEQGVQGIQGVPGPVGPAGLEWQGAWDAETSYVEDDAVGFGGASYFNILAITGDVGNTDPSVDTTHWALLAAQGAQGEQGVQGPQGPQGPAGSGGYTSYVAVISQSGTSNPVATVLFNNTGKTFTWGRTGIGTYAVNLSGTVDATKTIMFVAPRAQASKFFMYQHYMTGSNMFLKSYNYSNTAFEDDVMVNTHIEIRIYP